MRTSRGFTMIELLIVITVIGIVAAIAIPTLVNALDRGKQKRTMADLRAIGGAIQLYGLDNNIYPNTTSLSQLATSIEQYMDPLPRLDAWSHTFIYSGTGTAYTLGSPGKDGGTSLALIGSGGATQNFNDDIIYAMGVFVQWPEGSQQ